jgi:two-component system LytT family response regulator
MPIRVLVADDEPLARRRIVRLLRAERDVEVVAECATGGEALAALQAQAVDVALLDVQMPDMTGLEVVAAMGPEQVPAIIFVTAYDAYAVRAFEVHALDYLLKPVNAARVQGALRRAREHLERLGAAQAGRRMRALLEQALAGHAEAGGEGAALAAAADATGEARAVPAAATPEVAAAATALTAATAATTDGTAPAARPAERLMIKTPNRTFFLRVSEVDWFEACGNYVRVHVGKAAYLIRETITAVEASLDAAQFARIHRGAIVNIDRIRELQPWFAGDSVLILRDGTRLKLTRTYREQLRSRLHVIA